MSQQHPPVHSQDRTVIVAGAGPVGLTVALVLADAGHHVRVFEALDALPDDPRASTFHPPTLEMLERNMAIGTAPGTTTPPPKGAIAHRLMRDWLDWDG